MPATVPASSAIACATIDKLEAQIRANLNPDALVVTSSNGVAVEE